MNEIFYFFENITSQTRDLFLDGGLFLFLTLEFGIPFFKSPYNKLNHAKINVYGSRGNQAFQMSTDHAAGFRVYMYTGAYYRNGMLELYYCLNDGA